MPGPLCYRRQPLRRRIVLLALALGAVGFLPAKAEAAAGFAPCASAASIECATVAVPLDRTGALPGTVSLHVERSVPPTGASRGVMLLLAGGPGQPNANVFGLAQSAAGLRTLFPGYTLATYDVRGTGASDPLSCPALQSLLQSSDEQQSAKLVGDCGALLPDSRRFYSTRDHAEDIDAVRQALGVDRIALYGTSYGTKLEMAYALEFPDHVDRLLLDSVVPPEGHGPFGTDTLQAIPGALAQYCENSRCKAATPDFAGEVVALANRLGATPLRGSILVGAGSTRTQRLDGYQFLSLVSSSSTRRDPSRPTRSTPRSSPRRRVTTAGCRGSPTFPSPHGSRSSTRPSPPFRPVRRGPSAPGRRRSATPPSASSGRPSPPRRLWSSTRCPTCPHSCSPEVATRARRRRARPRSPRASPTAI